MTAKHTMTTMAIIVVTLIIDFLKTNEFEIISKIPNDVTFEFTVADNAHLDQPLPTGVIDMLLMTAPL
jgi:hypothetical protein